MTYEFTDKETQEKEERLFKYAKENFSIVGLDSDRGEKSFEELCRNTIAVYSDESKDIRDLPYMDMLDENNELNDVGIIQINDVGGRFHELVDNGLLLSNLLELVDSFYLNAYQNGYYHPLSPSHYWQRTIHFNMNLERLNESFKGTKGRFSEPFGPFESMFMSSSFMNYIEKLGFPNGIGNWTDQETFRRDYMLEHDIGHLIGDSSEIGRYKTGERYIFPDDEDRLRDFNERKLDLDSRIDRILAFGKV